jgi:hypothetical protein
MNATRPSTHERPGRVREIKGIVLQSDGQSGFGRWFIRPVESLNRRIVGIRALPDRPSLAMHTGIHVVLENGEEWVAEQLHGTKKNYLRSGFNWTPIETFRERDRGGWDVTIPPTAFRQVDDEQVKKTVARLNTLEGHPFLREDCTAFVEHMFSHQLFAHLPILGLIGLDVRIGDPALPLLDPNTTFDSEHARLLQFDQLRRLADTPWGFRPGLTGWQCARLMIGGVVVAAVARWLLRART